MSKKTKGNAMASVNETGDLSKNIIAEEKPVGESTENVELGTVGGEAGSAENKEPDAVGNDLPPVDNTENVELPTGGDEVVAPEVTPAPVVATAEEKKVVVEEEVIPEPVDLPTADPVYFSQEEKAAIETLLNYEEKMQKGRMNIDRVVIENQILLYRAVQNIINAPSPIFRSAFPKILEIIAKDAKGAFDDRRIYRAMENLTLPEKDRKAFPRILHLLKAICVPATRAIMLKQVSVEKSLEFGVTAHGRQNVSSFLNR